MDEQSPTTFVSSDSPANKTLQLPLPDLNSPKHEAAIKLQKVYRSFQTRRKLADCAVLIEQSWWKLIDFVELKRSSVSFFEVEKHESAVSRWSRAGTRAAKVGKGLSKNSKAQKLALQHWLEAIDPRHRYGHNLHFYYEEWLESQSNEPFFYWLDIGEGKEVNIVERCPRLKLQQQCIKYLGPLERTCYEVVVDGGMLMYKQSRLLVNAKEPKDVKWIFVLSTSMNLYVAQKRKGTFQHSSFLAGGATSAAGRIIVDNGILEAVWPHSGHYQPTQENFQDFIAYLRRNHVNLTNVKLEPADEEEVVEETLSKQQSVTLRSPSSGSDNDDDSTEEEDSNNDNNNNNNNNNGVGNQKGTLLPTLLIPGKEDFIERLKMENQLAESNHEEGEEEKDEEEEEEEEEEVGVSEEQIVERINIKRNMKSYQLGKQLSSKWSSGVGPRIGCLRDYPMELQFHTLEQAMLSPIPKGSSHHVRANSAIITNNNKLGEAGIRRQRRRVRKMSYSGELSRIREGFPLASPLRKFSARMDYNR